MPVGGRIWGVGAAGTHEVDRTAGFGGDNGAATSAQLYTPTGVAVDTAGNLYIADFANNRVRKVSTGGTITIHLDRKKAEVPRRDNETLLESARRAGLCIDVRAG